MNFRILQLARDLRAMSQTELAKRVGVQQASISRYENGNSDPDRVTLQKLSRILKIPTSLLLDDRERYLGAIGDLHFRKRGYSPRGLEKEIRAKLNLCRIVGSRLVDSDDQWALDWGIYEQPIGESESAAVVAHETRRRFRLPEGPVPDLTRVMEDAGCLVFAFPFGSPSIDACAQWRNGSPPTVAINSTAPGCRTRFSLAHELGHLVMHRVPTETDESEADQFAAEFLMPRDEIARDLRSLNFFKLRELKEKWLVSMKALIYRARTLELITEHKSKALYIEYNRRKYPLEEPGEMRQEQPALIRRLVQDAIRGTGSFEDAAELCQVHPDDLRVLVPHGLRTVS